VVVNYNTVGPRENDKFENDNANRYQLREGDGGMGWSAMSLYLSSTRRVTSIDGGFKSSVLAKYKEQQASANLLLPGMKE
jgi:hypothetical protein